MKKAAVYLFIAFIILSMIFTMVPAVKSQTDQAKDVKVLNYSYYIDNLGWLDVVGEIQNTGQNTLSTVGVGCTIYDSDGQIVGNNGMPAVANFILPQQKAPFYIQYPNFDQSGNGDTFDWTAKGVASFNFTIYSAPATSSYLYPDLQITDSSSSIGNTVDDKGVFWVTGHVQNTGSQTAQNVTIVGTFYNASGATVAYGYSSELNKAPSISPSESISFKLGAFDKNQTIVPQSDKIASYSLLIQVIAPIIPIMNGSAPTVTPAPTYVGASDNGGASLPNEVLIGIVVVVIVVLVGAVLAIRKLKGSQQETKKPKPKPTKKPQARPKRRR